MSYNSEREGAFVGRIITGKWSGRSYRIFKLLGRGMNGEVYLARASDREWAIKISEDSSEVALEFRLLKQLQEKAQGVRLGPQVVDLDDTIGADGNPRYFYVMEYIQGIPLKEFVRMQGTAQIGTWVSDLLQKLEGLHQLGYAFGDLKADNILIDPNHYTAHLVDFGGATPFDQAVRQFTAWYDRAYWQRGSRRADVGYDLFAVGILIAEVLVPDRLRKAAKVLDKNMEDLLKSVKISPWRSVLAGAWTGKYVSAKMMQSDLAQIEWPLQQNQLLGQKRNWDWTDWVAVGSVATAMLVIIRILVS